MSSLSDRTQLQSSGRDQRRTVTDVAVQRTNTHPPGPQFLVILPQTTPAPITGLTIRPLAPGQSVLVNDTLAKPRLGSRWGHDSDKTWLKAGTQCYVTGTDFDMMMTVEGVVEGSPRKQFKVIKRSISDVIPSPLPAGWGTLMDQNGKDVSLCRTNYREGEKWLVWNEKTKVNERHWPCDIRT